MFTSKLKKIAIQQLILIYVLLILPSRCTVSRLGLFCTENKNVGKHKQWVCITIQEFQSLCNMSHRFVNIICLRDVYKLNLRNTNRQMASPIHCEE
jgi:hypothetical protein